MKTKSQIPLVSIVVWEQRVRGRLMEIALSPEAFTSPRPRRGRYSVTSHVEEVGQTLGEIYDWVAGGGWAKHLKLHWTCPNCRDQDWIDWLPDTPNPCLCFGHCACVEKWLISYDPKPVNIKT